MFKANLWAACGCGIVAADDNMEELLASGDAPTWPSFSTLKRRRTKPEQDERLVSACVDAHCVMYTVH